MFAIDRLVDINRYLIISAVLAISISVSIIFSTSPAHAATITTVTVPMTIRAANSTETAGFETLLEKTVLPQNGPNINTSFTEIARPIHTGRLWTAYSNAKLAACDTNVSIAIVGDHQVTHLANSGAFVKAGDEPEVGGLIVDGNNTQMIGDAVGGEADMYVGQTIKFVSPEISTTVALVNSGLKIVMYVETRDDQTQKGVQASFRYSGTPQLKIWYDHTGCESSSPTTPTQTTVRSGKKYNSSVTTPTTIPTQVEGIVETNEVVESDNGKVVLDASSFSGEEQALALNDIKPEIKKDDRSITLYLYLTAAIAAMALGTFSFFFMRKREITNGFTEPYFDE